MSVWFDRKTKRYRIRIQRGGHETKRILPKGATRTQAEEEHNRLTRNLIDFSHGKQNPSLSEVILKYIDEELPKLKKSAKKTESHLKAISEYCIGKKLSEIDDVAKKYQKDMKGILAQGTIYNRLARLRRIANLAYFQWKLMDKPVKIVIDGGSNKRNLYLTVDQFWSLYNATDHLPTKDAMKIAVFTGLRRGNIFDPNIKKYIKGSVIAFPDTKNGKPLIVPIMDKFKEEAARLPIPCSPRTMYVHFKRAADSIGLPDLRFHDLRHTTASWLINAGVDMKTIADILGQMDIRSTDRYAHLMIETKIAALEKVFG